MFQSHDTKTLEHGTADAIPKGGTWRSARRSNGDRASP